MKIPSLLLLLAFAAPPAIAEWRIEDLSPAQSPDSPLVHERKSVTRAGETGRFAARRIDLAWFDSRRFTFRVVDNGPGPAPLYPGLADAMRGNGCVAGCNGGFFLPDRSPSGLMIAGGAPTGTFGTGGLLSGVVLSGGDGRPRVLRRAEYGEGLRATDLLQSGPFLVDRGRTVAGLSPVNSRRRTFVLHDGGEFFALGVSEAFTLAELGEVLAQPGFSPARPVHRALNLDGGTSSGLYLERGPDAEALVLEPLKTVRNFLGIVPR